MHDWREVYAYFFFIFLKCEPFFLNNEFMVRVRTTIYSDLKFEFGTMNEWVLNGIDWFDFELRIFNCYQNVVGSEKKQKLVKTSFSFFFCTNVYYEYCLPKNINTNEGHKKYIEIRWTFLYAVIYSSTVSLYFSFAIFMSSLWIVIC